MRVPRTSRVVLLVAILALPGGSGASASEPARDPLPLRFGVMVEEPAEPDRIIRAFSDLLSVLRTRLDPSVIRVDDVVISADMEDLSQRLKRGEVDLVIETVFASQLLEELSGCLEPRLALVRGGRREYRSVFFTRRDSPIERLEDLRARTLVLEAPRSTSAFALPLASLARLGIGAVDDGDETPEDAVRYVLAWGEINQAVWVAQGRGDAGAFNEGDWEDLPPRIRDELRIFHRTDPILRGLLSFRVGYPSDARTRVEGLLLGLHEEPEASDALARARITRFERLTTEDFAGLRRWEGALRTVSAEP